MIQLAVVSYPRLDEDDRQWIESIRATHDPQAGRIPAHVTLVFPARVSVGDIAAEVANAAGMNAPIPFVIRHATAVRNMFGNGGHVFLVPDEGGAEIVNLHDQLYQCRWEWNNVPIMGLKSVPPGD